MIKRNAQKITSTHARTDTHTYTQANTHANKRAREPEKQIDYIIVNIKLKMRKLVYNGTKHL